MPAPRNSDLVSLLSPYFIRSNDNGLKWFNVRSFGAVGDNSTNDAVAIQAAFDAASAYPGAVIFFPNTDSNIYRTASPLYFHPESTIRMAKETSIRLHASFTGFGILVSTLYRENANANEGPTVMEHVRIVGNQALGNYHGIVTMGQGTSLYQCDVSQINGDGILITNKTLDGTRITPGVNLNRQVVLNCRVHTCTGTGIKLDGPTDGYILFNHVNECDEHLIGTSAAADDGTIGAGGYQIVGNHISEAGKDGIRLGAGGFGTMIANNNVENFGITTTTAGTYAGIRLPWAGTHGLVVADNTIWTAEDGHASNVYRMIDVESSSDGNVQVVVTGNFGRGNLNAIPICVRLGSGATSINVQVSNNQMHRVVNPDFQTDFVRGNENSWDYGNAAPTAGTWRRSMRRWDDTPTVGSPYGWICSASGTPGTWTALANL